MICTVCSKSAHRDCGSMVFKKFYCLGCRHLDKKAWKDIGETFSIAIPTARVAAYSAESLASTSSVREKSTPKTDNQETLITPVVNIAVTGAALLQALTTSHSDEHSEDGSPHVPVTAPPGTPPSTNQPN